MEGHSQQQQEQQAEAGAAAAPSKEPSRYTVESLRLLDVMNTHSPSLLDTTSK
jgi:hypothetical protein